jgi:predicted MFS family arabinose efflux permease
MVVATSCGGVVAEEWGFRNTFFAAALLGIVSLVALLSAREPKARKIEHVSRHSFIKVASHPVLLMVSFMGILSQFANFASVFGFIPIYAVEIGASSVDLGIITMLTLASSTVSMLVVVNIAERWGDSFAISLSAVLMGIALLAVPLIQQVYVLAAVQVVYGLGRGGLLTLFMILAIKAIAPQQKATAMGVYQAVYAVGMMLGPLVSGYLADSLSLSAVFYLSASLCLVIAVMARLSLLARQ